MEKKSLEQALDEFLERAEYDKTYEAIYQLVKAAFAAGWKAREEQMTGKIRILEVHPSEN